MIKRTRHVSSTPLRRAVTCSALALCLVLTGCKNAGEDTGGGTADNGAAPGEGLNLLGNWKWGAPVVVFIHGWNRDGKPAQFINAEGWRKQGYNTLIFRWTQDAFDTTQCKIDEVLPFVCPAVAENRIWNGSVKVGERLFEQWKSFFMFRRFNKEIRVVGHSLGTQLTAYLAWKLHTQGGFSPFPARIDLIDPYVGNARVTGRGELPADSPFKPPAKAPSAPATSPCGAADAKSLYCIVENTFLTLQEKKKSVVTVYQSAVGTVFAKGLEDAFTTVKFQRDWTCKPFLPIGSQATCGPLRTPNVLIAQHVLPVTSYFWSMTESKQPNPGVTAKTATDALKQATRRLYLQKNTAACKLDPGKSLDSVINLAWQSAINSAAQLSSALLTQSGFTRTAAESCADEISFANDVFEAL